MSFRGRKGVWGQLGGPLMVIKDALSFHISKRCGVGRGPTNDDEGCFVSADLKCFR